MEMLKVQFTDNDIVRIKELKEQHPKGLIRKRMMVLWLKHLGWAHKDIGQIVVVSKPSIASYLRRFQQGGLDALLEWNNKGRASKLLPFAPVILEDFQAQPPCSLGEAADRIKEMTGVSVSQPRISVFLSRHGLRRLKTGNAPGKIDPVKQEEFKKKASIPYSWRPSEG
jgi:transposase